MYPWQTYSKSLVIRVPLGRLRRKWQSVLYDFKKKGEKNKLHRPRRANKQRA